MNKALQKWFGRDQEHVPDDDLLALLDGETSSGKTRIAKRHLESCWECRARYEQIEKTIFQIVGYRKQFLAPFLPPPSGGRRTFLVRLDQLCAEIELPWVTSLLTRPYFAFLHARPLRASVAVVLLAGMTMFLAWEHEAPAVSATELLRQAEMEGRGAHSTGVVFQKVRIHAGKMTAERMIYRDISGRRKPRLAIPHGADAELNETLEKAGINVEQPLSVEDFLAWHDHLAAKTDEVKSAGPDLLALVTYADSSPIKESSLSVRRADFHPVARRVVMRDSEEIGISEISYDVLGWDETYAASLFQPPAPSTTAPQQPEIKPVRSLDAELAVRYALHGLRADLGEPIDVKPGSKGPGSISVIGIVSTPERKQELLAALNGMQDVAAHVRTEEEAAQMLPQTPSRVRQAEPLIVTAHSPLEKELLEHFGDPLAVDDFTKRVGAVNKDLMAHAWALRRLSEQYPVSGANDEPALSPSSRQLLHIMRHDHLRAMSEAASQLTALLGPVLQPIAGTASEPAVGSSMFAEAQRVQQLTFELLSGSAPTGPDQSDPTKAAHDLLTTLRGLQLTLQNQL
jgi:hypothetical protein